MIIDFPVDRTAYGEYCITCHALNAMTAVKGVKKSFACSACGATNDRTLIIDPKLNWWLDNEQNYWHESVGILLVRSDGAILFYELSKFPFGCTIPAGHVDSQETPLAAVVRETQEETGIVLKSPVLVVETNIPGDSCRRGCDHHKWSLFAKGISWATAEKIKIDAHEGHALRWLQLAELRNVQLPAAMRFIFETYSKQMAGMTIYQQRLATSG